MEDTEGTTGISKNALKKQQKAEEAAKKKLEKEKEKAIKAALEPQKVKISGEDEELDPTKYFENRTNAIAAFEKSGNTAYPHKFHNSHRFSEFLAEFGNCEDGSHLDNIRVSISGRVISKRGQAKLMFYDIDADGMKIQMMSSVDNYEGEKLSS